MTTSRCPICARTVAPPGENETFPFCSGRCKLIDLGNWLDGRYRVPGPSVAEVGDDDGDGADPGNEGDGESSDDHAS